MELRNDPNPERRVQDAREARERAIERMADASEAHSASIRETVDRVRGETAAQSARLRELGTAGDDRVELSSVAREAAAEAETRAARVADLRAAYENGTLNGPERVERAADRILGEA